MLRAVDRAVYDTLRAVWPLAAYRNEFAMRQITPRPM